MMMVKKNGQKKQADGIIFSVHLCSFQLPFAALS